MAVPRIVESESVGYVAEVIGSDPDLTWFTDAPASIDDISGVAAFSDALDVYTGIAPESVTWLWSVAPITIDQLLGATEGLRALRHPAGWTLLIDGDDPAFLWVEPDADIYRSGQRTVVTDSGTVPRSGVIGRLGESPFDVRAGVTSSRISAALALWVRALLDAELEVNHAPVDRVLREAIGRLASAISEDDESTQPTVVGDEELDGLLEDAREIIGERQSAWWVQTELTWPDQDGEPCFPGSIQVHVRESDGALSWLAELVPSDPQSGESEVVRLECDGWDIEVALDDPYVIRVPYDRLVFSVGRASDSFEAAGFGVALGSPPAVAVWDSLRAATAELEGGVAQRTPGWSEERVSESLAAWFLAGTGRQVEFWYDPDDPVSRQGEIANRDRADAVVRPSTSVDRRCMYVRPDALPFEIGARCASPQQFHFRSGDDVVFVCDQHVPDGVSVTPVMQR